MFEWHPFSVSSGPREKTVEVHIRGLGDATNALVELSKTCDQLWIRVDGPYGNHKLNYRRYPVSLMVGGGIGISPVIGMVKDIYNVGDLSSIDQATIPPHCIDNIYVVWVMREESVHNWFCDELQACYRASQQPGFPSLYVWIYVTGVTRVSRPDLFAPGRPDWDLVFDTIVEQNPSQKPCNVFACGPGPMVNECWDHSVRRKQKGRRFDFIHEIFDF
jgi:respiratory burst oxidase